MPYPRYHRAAKFAFVSRQVIGGNKISPALDQQVFTVVTVSVVARVAGHVADIGIMNSLLHGQLPVAGQGGHGSRWQSIQFVARKETQKVKRIIRTDIF